MSDPSPAPRRDERPCPCGSGRSYGTCCMPFHHGKAKAPTVVGTSEVGYRQRVTDRPGLERAIAGLCR